MKNRFILPSTVSFFFALGMRGLLAVSGPPPDENPEGNMGALKTRIETGCGYDVHSGNASRSVTDLRVPGALGVYGLDFTRHWNSVPPDEVEMVVGAPIDFGDSGWVHSWGWSAAYTSYDEQQWDGGPVVQVTKIAITFPDGHVNAYKLTRSTHAGYPYAVGETDFAPPGEGVHDYLGKMAPDGFDFWLYLRDGGSVHFTGGQGAYRASEVFDPHGFRTELNYDPSSGRLHEVRQDGGRYLILTWGTFLSGTRTLITQVEARSSTGGSQHVTYKYQRFGPLITLAKVTYQNDPAPGQETSAFYTYSAATPSDLPILTVADDPRFAGPMTKIIYTFTGVRCPHGYGGNPPYYNAKLDYFYATPESIASELSGETGVAVSSFQIGCYTGKRKETNGLNGSRTFYFGRSSGDFGTPRIMGYQLAKATDFTSGDPQAPSLPFVHQNYNEGHPWKVWDARGQLTILASTGGGDCGLPGEIHHLDNSVEYYNRVDSSGSEERDEARIPNPHQSWLFWKKDERGQTTYYRRDARRRVKRIDYPDESYETFEYDNNNPDGLNQVTRHRMPSGAIETYVYHPNTHLLMEEDNSVDSVDGRDARKEYTYDSLGRVLTMRDGRARQEGAPFTVRMTYNGRHQVLSVEYASTTGTYPTVRYAYDKYGNCITITDELGNRKEYTYDAYRRCTSYTEWLSAPAWNGNGTVDSRRWDWRYDRQVDGLTVLPLRPPSSHTSKEWGSQFEPAFNADGERRATSRTFDVNNRITSEQTGLIQPAGEIGLSNPWRVGPDTETHYFTYDANGLKSSYKDPRERLTTYEYDNRNRLWKTNETVNTIPRTTETLYDPTGNKTFVKFPDDRTQQWLYHNAFGQPRQYIDERGNVTDLTYWQWGPMKKLGTVTTHRLKDNEQWEDQETRFYYDFMGRPQQTYFPDNTHEYMGYEFGQLKVWETRKHQIKTIVYDARGREQSHTWSDGTPGVTRVWDDANRLSRIANFFSAIDYQYDGGGQVWWERNTITGSGGAPQTTYYRYPSGEVSRVTYPNGTVVNRTYTARGQLQSTVWTEGNVNYAYLPDGKVDYEDYGNGVRSDLDYDGRGFINLSRTYRLSGGQTYAKRDYWRDERDRIKGWKKGNDVAANPMENGRGDRYDYDWEGQLFRASYQVEDPENNPTNALRADSFTYDELGNRVRWNYVASRGAMDFKRRDNKLNQYESWENNYQGTQHWGSAIYYDNSWGSPPGPTPTPAAPGNGDTMADGWITASYNALNQPMAMGNIGYGSNFMWFWFDPLGRCVKRWMGTDTGAPVGSNPITYFYYDGWNLIQEGSTATAADRVYVHGNRVDEIVASAAGGNWLYHHYDARGHCILQTNTSGGLQEQYDYDAFGWPYFYTATGAPAKVNGKAASPSGNRFLFTGREFLSGLRIYDYRNRMYQPELGRFLQPDPQQFAAGDYNLYRYCHNDPVNKTDPLGLYVSGLTSFGGGDWVKGMDGITNRERDLMKTYSSWQAAGDSRVGQVYNAIRGPNSREAWAPIGERNDGANYTAGSVRAGNGVEGVDDEHYQGRAQTSTVSRGDLPSNYRMSGFVLGHKFYDPKFIQDDMDRAKAMKWNAIFVSPSRAGDIFKGPKVIYYDYTKPPPPF